MPRKYLAMPNDVFSLVSVTTIYSMINPIEKKLVAAGYKGPLLADFNNDIYKTARCGRQRSHTEITGAKKTRSGRLRKKGRSGMHRRWPLSIKKQLTTL